VAGFGEVRLHVATSMFDVPVSEVPEPTAGDTLTLDGETFVVQVEPTRDRERLVWTLDTRPTSGSRAAVMSRCRVRQHVTLDHPCLPIVQAGFLRSGYRDDRSRIEQLNRLRADPRERLEHVVEPGDRVCHPPGIVIIGVHAERHVSPGQAAADDQRLRQDEVAHHLIEPAPERTGLASRSTWVG
jgi:hypothetical protein